MISLRSFQNSDADLLHQNQYPGLNLREISAMIDEWNMKIHDGKRFEMFAVQADEKTVGSISLFEHSKSIASAGIIVFADERQKGYASAAMELLTQHARRQGYRAIRSQVRSDNTASIRLHEKLGFETDGYVYRNRRDHEVLFYYKFL